MSLPLWACGAAGSALPWHGRGHRFDPGQVHQSNQQLSGLAEKTRYAFDTLVLMLHPPQHFLRLSSIDPEEHRPPGFEPPAWLASKPLYTLPMRESIPPIRAQCRRDPTQDTENLDTPRKPHRRIVAVE